MKIKHLAARIEGCKRDLLSDETTILQTLEKVVKVLDMRLIKKFIHKFNPGGGISALFLIAESHIAFHSWPEIGFADVEIVTCKESADVEKGLEVIVKKLKPKRVVKKIWEYKMFSR
jgi:S-adenosylmethionine decarboxylase proenzyme